MSDYSDISFLQQEKLTKCNAKVPFVWDFQTSRESPLCLLCMQSSIPLLTQGAKSLGSSRPICNWSNQIQPELCELPVHTLLQLICQCTVAPIWPKCIKLTKHASNNCTAYAFLRVLHLLCTYYTAHFFVQKNSGNGVKVCLRCFRIRTTCV